jgi:hypothetical protein
MPRTLTVARVRVRSEAERDYLAIVGELSALAESRGRHLWVFRSVHDPELFLEFTESRSAETHPAVAGLPPDERRLDERRMALAPRQPDASDLWEELRT